MSNLPKQEDARPDGWERFTKAVDAAVKSGPMHKTATKKTAGKTSAKKPAA